jgi:hypothetical protein
MKEEQGENEGGSGNQPEEEKQAKEENRAKEKAGHCPAFFTSRLTSSVTPGSL